MGCAGSKQPKSSSSKTSSKKPVADTTKTTSNNNNNNKAINLPNQVDVNGNKTAKIDVINTDDSKNIDDQIVVDRNLLNSNSSNIYSYVTRNVKLKLVANEVSQKADENNDTGVNKDAFINDVSTKSLNFIKNGKCKTYTSLKKSLKESKLPNIREKDFVCESVVGETKKCVQIIQKNKDNKNFDFNNEIDLFDKQLADELQQKKQLEQKHQQQEQQQKDNVDQVIHRTGRVLSWSDANKIARTLFYKDTVPVIHASTTGKKGYVVYKVQDDSTEQPLNDNEIDDILSPKPNSISNNNNNNISSNISSSLNNSLSQDQNNLSLSIRPEQTVAVRSSEEAVAIIPDQTVAVRSSEQTVAIIPDQTVAIVPDQTVAVKSSEQTVVIIPDQSVAIKNESQSVVIRPEQTVAIIPDQTVSVSSEEGRLDDILKQTLLDDRLHNNHSFKDSYSLNNKNIESAAVIIQSSFRGHQTRESLDSQRTAEHKPEVVAEKPAVQKTEHVEKAAEPVVHSQTNDVIPSVVHDSNKQESHSKDIQSEEASIHEFNNDVQLQRRAKSPNENETLKREEDVNIAATIIQSTFRGYKTRKELEGKGLIHKTHSDSHLSEDSHHLSSNTAPQEAQQIPTSTPTPAPTPNQSPPVQSPVTLNINENDEISKLIELIQPMQSETSNISTNVSNVESSNDNNRKTDSHKDDTNESDQINKAATRIQATYRGYHTRKELDDKTGKKKKKNKNKAKETNSEVKEASSQQSSEHASATTTDDVVQKLLEQIQQSEQQLEQHHPQQPQQTQHTEVQHTPEVIEISVVDIDKAATRIQSTFRGYKTRKDLHITHPLHHSTISSENPVDSSNSISNANNVTATTPTDAATAATNDTNISSNNNNTDISNDNKALSKRQKKNRKNKQKQQQQTSQGNQQESNNAYINEENNGENLANDDDDDVRNEAATKIQATFRGFQTRRTLNESQKKPE